MNRKSSPLTRDCRQQRAGVMSGESGSSSLPCMCLAVLACAPLVISLYLVLVVQPAQAATWPLSTSELSATLAFHQSYTAGKNSYVHSGIDIPASAGMQISSPLAGTVRFTGAVPSGDSRTGGTSSQKTMQAVSIEVAGGRVVTLMPLATTQVQVGQQVSEGTPLGTLAASGDVSSPGTHLHMGYKQGSTYLDPMQLFGAAAPDAATLLRQPERSAQHGVEESLPGGAVEGAPSVIPGEVPEGTPSVIPSEVPEGSPSVIPSGAAEGVPSVIPSEGAAGTAVEGSPSFGTIETGSFERAARTAPKTSLLAPVTGAFESLASACYGQCTALAQTFVALSQGTGVPLPVFYVALFAMGLGGLALLGVVFVRLFGERIRAAWKLWSASTAHNRSLQNSPLVPARGR